MNKVLLLLVVTVIGTCAWAGAGGATPILIEDTYIGGSPTNPSWYGRDVVGDPRYFDISKMTVGFVNPTDRSLNLSFLMLDGWDTIPEFGVHWTMTRGNDVIEGRAVPAAVPEPGTMFLLGTGMVALAMLGRRMR